MTAHAAESVSTHLADRSILATGNPNQMKMSPRSSENPTNNPIPRAAHLLPDCVQRPGCQHRMTCREVDGWVFSRDRPHESARHVPNGGGADQGSVSWRLTAPSARKE